MDGLWGTAMRRGRVSWVVLAVCLAGPVPGRSRLEASPIKTTTVVTSDTAATLGPAWAKFLIGGPFFWSVTPPPSFPSNLQLETNNGRVVDTPFVDYLVWRRNQDPTRFDFYHPVIGPELASLIITPKTPSNPPVNLQPQLPGVPEPGGLVMALMIVTAFAGWRQRGWLKPV